MSKRKCIRNWAKSVRFDRFRLIASMFGNRDQLFSGPIPVTRLSKSSPVINHKMIYNSGTLRFHLYLRLFLFYFFVTHQNQTHFGPAFIGVQWEGVGKVLPGGQWDSLGLVSNFYCLCGFDYTIIPRCRVEIVQVVATKYLLNFQCYKHDSRENKAGDKLQICHNVVKCAKSRRHTDTHTFRPDSGSSHNVFINR